LAVIGYYPKITVVLYSFFRWVPEDTLYWVGMQHYTRAFTGDPIFWQSFQVVAIMLAANLFKMWPAIIVAIALHRLKSDRWRYIYQVLFVVPMVIPALVWLLIWKSFYDANVGILNKVLNATGLMSVLNWMDDILPTLANAYEPVGQFFMQPVFGSSWGLMLLGAMVVTVARQEVWNENRVLPVVSLLVTAAWVAVVPPFAAVLGPALPSGALMPFVSIVTVVLLIGFAQAVPRSWVLWAFWLLGGIWVFWGELYRLPIAAGAALLLGWAARYALGTLRGNDVIAKAGWIVLAVAALIIGLTQIWVHPIGAFQPPAWGGEATPSWLGNKYLILPALILWGFPWVGVVGVLIYLAGLQQISNDVYEAAELDGVGPIGKLFQIELPLIMTQVRINLIFMTIGTLTGYEFFLILLGPEGGTENVGMVPGLYMYNKAFLDNEYGYACALGMVLFVMILLLTIVYQRYVKVEK
jgi:ABC-type sugar transport system permease subunit